MLTFRNFFTAVLTGSTFIAIPVCAGQSRVEMDLSGAGWKLWQDKDATWANDELFFHPVNLSMLPTNPPSVGWGGLESGGRDVSVPGTVEEYLHPGDGPEGVIKGVSGWWRKIRIPHNSGGRI